MVLVQIILWVLLWFVVSLSLPLVLLLGVAGDAVSGPIMTYRTTRKMTMEHVVGDADERFYESEIDEEAIVKESEET